ncbi:hypothetical protein RJ641_020549 [Dillenia turbinata]|uniref:Uncharacterized protein n=1 Tax=Dillenia turbinata TaxID=194707 RepID=A0AAN8UTY7_9MAGN
MIVTAAVTMSTTESITSPNLVLPGVYSLFPISSSVFPVKEQKRVMPFIDLNMIAFACHARLINFQGVTIQEQAICRYLVTGTQTYNVSHNNIKDGDILAPPLTDYFNLNIISLARKLLKLSTLLEITDRRDSND